MKFISRTLSFCLVFFVAFPCKGQTGNSAAPKHHPFRFYLGVGPNYYLNNLEVGRDYVQEFNYSVSGKIMWEPEYNLSIGIESGYYFLYSMDLVYGPSMKSIRFVNTAIPIQLVLSMKFFEDFYASFSLGQSILHNFVTTSDYGTIDASTLSLGDYSASIGHRKQLTSRLVLASELKGYYSSKLEDKNISLLFMLGYSF